MMKSIDQLMTEIYGQGIRLWADDQRLRYKAPQGVLTPALQTELGQRKAEILDFLRQAHSSSTLPQVRPDPAHRHYPFPLTDIQQAYWMGRDGAFALSTPTHDYTEIEAEGFDTDRLGQAWQRVIERHEMLRAVILPSGEQQILAHTPPYEIKVYDLIGADADTIAVHVEAVRQRMWQWRSPPDQWPLFDIRFTRLEARRMLIHISLDMLMADWHSYEILFREWYQLYHNPDQALPPLDLSFRDYVLTEKRLETTALYQQAQAYWLHRLETLPAGPDLPLARDPAALAAPQFKRYQARLTPAQWQPVQQQANQLGLTPTAILLAAYAEVLAQWSQRPQFTLNLVQFNWLPLHPQVNDIVGDFTSLTLLAVDHPEPQAFQVRAKTLQQQLWQDLDHRYFSGVRVLRALMQNQAGGGQVGMPVVFTSGVGGILGKGPRWLGQVTYSLSQTPQVWIDAQAEEQDEALLLVWDAVEALFPEGMLADMFQAYVGLLQRLVTDPSAWTEPAGPLVPATHLAQRVAINATQAPLSQEMLHTLFLAQVERCADAPAVIAPDRSLTYQHLYQQACQVGHWLRAAGAIPDTLVAVVMEPGWEQVVAVLGILMSGAAYLPIDPELPTERQHYLLAQGQISLALTQSHLILSWPENIQRLAVDTAQLPDQGPLDIVQKPTDLAYVIYTSGSTGLPKGVMIDHRGALNTILGINRRFGVTEQDRVLALSTLNFDLSVYDIFGLLAVGGSIVLPAASLRRDPAHWAELMVQHEVTLWDTVPALMQMLVDYLEPRQDDPALARGKIPLRVVMMSGDWVPVTLPDRIKALWLHAAVYSLGGATEASIWSIYYPIEQVASSWTSIPYGKPLTNQSFHVLDAQLNPRPVWVPGDLYIGGIGLALGYWKDEAMTRERFIVHPRTGERLYKTGDLGRYLPDGNIEFLGRSDFQVKIRGHRVELGEIESTLLQHPAVKECVVNAVGDPKGDKQLIAYVVRQDTFRKEVDPIPEAYSPEDPTGVLNDALAQAEFKLRQPGLRTLNGEARLDLPRPVKDNALRRLYLARQSYRQFLCESIPLEQFSAWLGNLCQLQLADAPLPKYRYPSAGSLYPVQTYLYVRPHRIEGVVGGFYYYHPAHHQLARLSADEALAQRFLAGSNQAIFAQAAFVLVLVGNLNAIAPLYGGLARELCLLEAGYISQLLMMEATSQQLGCCPLGAVEEAALRTACQLEEQHLILHSLACGRIDPVQMTQWLQPAPPTRTDFWQAQLQSFLQHKLPAYMVPTTYVELNTLPLTANGKVDRQALPSPALHGDAKQTASVAPRTPIEQKLADLWCAVLKCEQVSVDRSFFEMGGDSLLATQMLARIRQHFQIDLSSRTFFTNPTIAQLGSEIKQKELALADSQALQAILAELKGG